MKKNKILCNILILMFFQTVTWAQPAINLFSTGENLPRNTKNYFTIIKRGKFNIYGQPLFYI